jgi:hypothetical protein
MHALWGWAPRLLELHVPLQSPLLGAHQIMV